MIAFVFPGQGAQYPDMLRDLSLHFPEVRERFEIADRILAGCFQKPLSGYVFPPPQFGQAAAKEAQRALAETNIAQPALGAAEVALLGLLRKMGVCSRSPKCAVV
jgi:malonyl CoA-acyl carrier protein transacylase